MSFTPRSFPTSSGTHTGSTGFLNHSTTSKSLKTTHQNLIPITAEFYNPRFHSVTIIRLFGYLVVTFYLFLVFMCKKTGNVTSPLYLSFMSFHNHISELYLVILDLYKRCPAVTGAIKKLRFEVPYFIKMLSLNVPKYERTIMYFTNFNTLNNWVSLFVILTFMFLMELFVTILDNIIVTYKSKKYPRFCINTVRASKFHDKSFTQDQINKLLSSREYINLKNSRSGMGPESWNWQLRKTLKNTNNPSKSQNNYTSGYDSDSSS